MYYINTSALSREVLPQAGDGCETAVREPARSPTLKETYIMQEQGWTSGDGLQLLGVRADKLRRVCADAAGIGRQALSPIVDVPSVQNVTLVTFKPQLEMMEEVT